VTILSELRQVVRSLANARSCSIAVIVTLALGTGANTAMFTLLRGTMLRPLPNHEGERLVYLRQSAAGAGQSNVLFSVPEIIDYRSASRALGAVAEYSGMTFTMMSGDEPVHIDAGVISGNYFEVMGLVPVLGRVTNAGDDGPGAAVVGVLSYDFWQQHFGGDRNVVGRTVRVNDRPLTIIGVVQRAPHYPAHTDVFVNMVTSPHHLDATMLHGRTHRMTEVFARLSPGSTVEQSRTELARIAGRVHADHPEAYEAASKFEISVLPLKDAINERARLTIWLLMGAAGFVLLIACANVANLTLMRGLRRERELQVRVAMGAGSWRLRRLLLMENLTLALIGSALGVLVAQIAIDMLIAFADQFTPRADEIRLDAVVLGVSLLISMIAAIVLSAAPRLEGTSALTASGKRSTAGRTTRRLQHALVVAQFAVCVVLLTAAGLLIRTLSSLQAVETGVRTERVLTLELPIESDLITFDERLAMYERMRGQVAALPGVQIAALGSNVPLVPTQFMLEVKAEGRVTADNEATPRAIYKTADPGYFDAAGIQLLKGRMFSSTDRRETAKVVVLNASLAERLFPGQDPIGRRVAWTGEVLQFIPVSGEWRTVVGIVHDTRDNGLDADATPTLYQPFAQEGPFAGALLVRTQSDPLQLSSALVRTIRDLYPQQLIENMATLEEVRDSGLAPRRLNALFIACFGALAMLIAVVGIAGVLAFSVSSRTNEIGIRMSLGANASGVLRMILREGGVLLIAGLGLGLTAALLSARLLRGLLFGIAPHDPATIVSVIVVIGAAGIAACLLPALRAARVSPAVALRAE